MNDIVEVTDERARSLKNIGHVSYLLHLVVEIKGYRGEDAKDKANTMDAYWVPGVNNLGTFGRWAFAELKESVYAIAANFDTLIDRAVAGRTA